VQVFGLMMVRNAADILQINLLHHLALGIDQFLIVDNGSTDGTSQILEQLSRDTGRVQWTRDEGPYRQAEITTGLAHEAYLQGADWVVPVDADEFWHAPGGDLRQVLERTEAGALGVQLVNFVQRREQLEATPDGLLHMTRRVAHPVGPIERIIELVESQQIGFVEILYPPKWISRATAGIEIGIGNHNVSGIEGAREATDEIVCLHAPLRARSALESRIVHGRRVEEVGNQRSWHVIRWRRLAEADGLDSEWRANSYEENSLDVYGVERPLVTDSRLRDVVAPWLGRCQLPEFVKDIASSGPLQLSFDTSSQAALVDCILARMRDIDGWLSEPEACLLMTATVLALIEQQPHSIVEVGSYCGRSTVVLGSVVNAVEPDVRVYAIDPHQGQISSYDTETRFESPTLDLFKRNIAEAGLENLVELIPQYSFDVRWNRPISLLFIDGLHDYENVSRDFAHFAPWVTYGGYVAFDDYDSAFPGVIAFVDQLLTSGSYQEVQRVGRMIVTQKTSDAHPGSATPEDVEGPIFVDRQNESANLPSTQKLAERLVRQEKGIAFLRGLIRDELTRREALLGERDAVILAQQMELHEKVGEANRVMAELRLELHTKLSEANRVIAELQLEQHTKIHEREQSIRELQQELHNKLSEANGVISELQAELHAKVGEANVVIQNLHDQLAAAREALPPAAPAYETQAAGGAELPAQSLAEHDRAIRSLDAELTALRGSGAWRMVGVYSRLCERLRARVGRLLRRSGEGR
jgi:predicted O-methyltransferase YrrM